MSILLHYLSIVVVVFLILEAFHSYWYVPKRTTGIEDMQKVLFSAVCTLYRQDFTTFCFSLCTAITTKDGLLNSIANVTIGWLGPVFPVAASVALYWDSYGTDGEQ